MMKKTIYSMLLAVMLLPTAMQAQKWTNLFDGKTFAGWKQLNGQAKYEIKNGVIIGTTVANTPNSFMTTEKTYGDFILELELKVDNSMNSGIQIRSLSKPEFNNGRVHGYQVEIDPSDRGWSGGIYDEARRGWLYQNEMNPAAKKAFKRDAWNKYRIEAIGSVIRTWINDVPVANLIDDMTPEGFIALQVHAIGKEDIGGKQVMWKNVRIQTGKDMQPRPADGVTPVENYTLNTLSEQEKSLGFKLLFNGKDLTGFRSAFKTTAPPKVWTVEEGMLHVNSSGGKESGNGGDILTNDKFGAFELVFDFKLTEGANSGVKYFVNEIESICFEIKKRIFSNILLYQFLLYQYLLFQYLTGYQKCGFTQLEYMIMGQEYEKGFLYRIINPIIKVPEHYFDKWLFVIHILYVFILILQIYSCPKI
jgi:hypothetical protein